MTDEEGKFQFDGLEAGTYSLAVERRGFLRQEYGVQGNPFLGTPLTIRGGERLRDVTVKLIPQGVITGRVVTDDRESLQHAQVSALRLSSYGVPGSVNNQTTTNDLGEFRLADLAPGRYLLHVKPQRSIFGAHAVPEKKSDRAREALLPTYYPGTMDLASASAIEVGPGQETTVMLQVNRGRVYRISGRILGTPSNSSIQTMLLPRQKGPTSLFGRSGPWTVRQDGAFHIHSVPPGSYYLFALSQDGNALGRPQPVSRVSVDLTDRDVDGLVVQVTNPVEITGAVRVEGEQPANPVGMRVMLSPAEVIPFSVPTAMVDNTGGFKLASVMPDRYHLNFYAIPDGYYVHTTRFRDEDALRSGMQVTGAGKIEVFLSPGAATVWGVVRRENKPLPGAFVMLAAERYGPETMYLRRTGNSDQNGRYEFKGLAPGTYRIYAWQEPQVPLPEDAQTLMPLESKAPKITVRGAEIGQADVDVIPATKP